MDSVMESGTSRSSSSGGRSAVVQVVEMEMNVVD